MNTASIAPAAPQNPTGPTGNVSKKEFKRVLAGSMFGAVLEWYDFAIYGVLAVTILGPAFFPGHDDTAKLLAALATQGLGFVARPLGGLVFGHLGDRFGRKPMLVATFIMLGLTTSLIGLLPTYADWGITATILLVALRMIQGFALGGEFGAAVLLVSEYGEPKRRGFWTAWPQTGGPAGTILATLVMTILMTLLPADDFTNWGWRIAFLLALPLLLIGWIIRRTVEETPAFRAAQQAAEAKANELHAVPEEKRGILAVFSEWPAILQGLGLRVGENVAFYVYTVFVVSYATKNLHYNPKTVLWVVTAAAACQFIGMLLGGAISDRVGRRPAMLAPAAFLLVWAPIFFLLAQQKSLALLCVAVLMGALAHGMLAGPEAAWLTELFPTKSRYAGVSIAVQGSSIFAGAPAPLIAVWLANSYGWKAVAGYLAITVLISIVALLWGPETRGTDLGSQTPAAA